MERKSIAKNYYLLAADKNGNMPPLHAEESYAGLAAAGFMDLLLYDIVSVEKKRIIMRNQALPEELAHLAPLHAYLSERPRTMQQMITAHRTGSRSCQLAASVGKSLLEAGLASQGQGGPFGPRVTYIPQESSRQEAAGALKAALQEGTPALQDTALLWCLKASGNLDRYFLREERTELNARLKEQERSPQDKEMTELFRMLRDESAVIAASFLLLG